MNMPTIGNRAVLLLTAFMFFFLSGTAPADPIVDPVNGTLQHGQIVTVSGTGFGPDGAADIVWDGFSDGVVDNTADVGSWGSVNDLAVANEARHPRSRYAAYHNFTTEATAGVRCVNGVLSRSWFVQYWVKLDDFDWGTGTYGSNHQHLANVKFLRFWNPGSVMENFYTQFWWGLADSAYSNPENVPGQTTKVYDIALNKSSISDGHWHLLQFEFVDSSAPSIPDAVFRVFHNGRLIENRTGFVGRTTGDLKRPFFIGFYNAWGPGSGESSRSPNHYYMDDIYAAPTLARVEIGNAPNYQDCTHREIQIPTAWASDGKSISIRINLGSFADGSAYLFVIDPDGAVNAPGCDITLGGNTPGIPPAAPTGLTVE